MAKAKVSAADKEKEQLLDVLRKLVDGRTQVLHGTRAQNPVFPGGAAGQKLLDKAMAEGYVEEQPPPEPPRGKSKTPPRYGRLTDTGRRFLIDSDPVVKLLGELQPTVKELAQRIPAQPAREPSQDEQITQMVRRSCDELKQTLEALLDQAVRSLQENLLRTVQEMQGPSPAAQLGQVLLTVQQVLERAYPEALKQAGGTPEVSVPAAKVEEAKPEPTPPPTVPVAPAEPLRDVLHRAYDNLCLMVDYRDGLVELPHLYHEVQKSQPGLTVEAFHREVQSLWRDREIQLHILNEVRTAKEPEKGIWWDDKFYYYLLWSRP
jgi:hypothetical protein